MADEKKEAPAEPTAAKPAAPAAPGKPILLIIVAVLNMVAMVAVVMITMKSHKEEAHKAKLEDVVQGEVDDAHKQAEHGEKEENYIGKIMPLETFLVNLSGANGRKVVKVNMELELDGEKVEEELEKRKPQIRDIVLNLLGSKTYDEVNSVQGREQLRTEIRDNVNAFLVKGKIKQIYFTELIVN